MKNDRTIRAIQIVDILRKATCGMQELASTTIINQFGKNPFLILISCLLSLRTKDTVSLPASQRLFAKAQTPQDIVQIPVHDLEIIIYPVAFYRRRAKNLHEVCRDLLDRFNGSVPSTLQELLTINGVGLKTANLVLAQGFDIPAICVDTHVHRISNRLGLVTTDTPAETEQELKKVLPQEYWIEYGQLVVVWGQNICVPISPKCSQCPIISLCPRIAVTTSR
ncbi:MAG TPA: endonuclease III [Candidatus Babeliales bacterium]|nr:endonuclease III [Candidatus Babeliales bacterium]